MQRMSAILATTLGAVSDGLLLVVTGAGVSRASGIATFRGSEADAVWRLDDVEMATAAFFHRDPVAQWRWYLERFAGLDAAEPNAAHRALAALEHWQEGRGGRFLLVTQNIDMLHERAGSRRLIKVHGTADRLRCSSPGCRLAAPAGSLPRAEADLAAFRRQPVRERLPRCPECGAWLRPHVLFFDEYYTEHHDYRFDEVQAAAADARTVLFVGTSFSVGVTALLQQEIRARGLVAFSVDPAGGEERAGSGITVLRAAAENLLPAVCDRLGCPA